LCSGTDVSVGVSGIEVPLTLGAWAQWRRAEWLDSLIPRI
jgi:hypothetical protein